MKTKRLIHDCRTESMKIAVLLAAFCGLCVNFACAEPKVGLREDMEEAKDQAEISQEINGGYSYVGASKTTFGNIDEQNGNFSYVIAPQLEEGIILRIGGGWENFSFGLPSGAVLPNTLQSVNAIVGADFEIDEEWLMRIETAPGVYSDWNGHASGDINSPTTIGFSYLVDKDLQWFFGLGIDPLRQIPVLPGAGVRWKFDDKWTLMFLFPKPRLEYEINDRITAYVGGELKGGSYKVNDKFGDDHGTPKLNNATVDYTEVRIGGGLSFKPFAFMTISVEGGAMAYRNFDFYSESVHYSNDDLAPYGQISLKCGF